MEGYMENNETRGAHMPSRRETLEYTLQSLMSITQLDMDTSLKFWEVQREQFTQQWLVEDMEWRLCVIWRLRNSLFRAPLPSEEALCWGIRLVKDILGELKLMGQRTDLSPLNEKVVDIMEEIIRAALHSTLGAQVPRKVILTACDVGEMIVFQIQNSGLKGRAIDVVRMFGELSKLNSRRVAYVYMCLVGHRPIVDVMISQYFSTKDSQNNTTYPSLIGSLEAIHGFSLEEDLKSPMIPINSATLIAGLGHGRPPKVVEAAIRLLFIGWVNGYRELPGLTDTSQVEDLIQELESYKVFLAYPQIGVRVALIFIYNEMYLKDLGRGFKPSTNFRTIQLLKAYVCYNEVTQSDYVSSRPTRDIRCILHNASWTLPWLWGQREIDEEFVMAVTVAWILDSSKDVNAESTEIPDGHPVQAFIKQYSRSLIEILMSMFNNTFYYDSYILEGQIRVDGNTISRLNKLLWMALLLFNSIKDLSSSSHAIAEVVKCFLMSVDQEWIDATCWRVAVITFSKTSQKVLARAVQEAGIAEKLILSQQIILRELESILNYYPSDNTTLSKEQEISSHLDTLIALAHFTAYIIASHDGLRLSFSRQSHFNSSLVNYIIREAQDSLSQLCQPELLWKHATSVGVITELVVQTRRSLSSQDDGAHKLSKQSQGKAEQVVFHIVNRLLRGDLEVQYILAPLCGLLGGLQEATSFPTKNIIYFKVMQEFRALLLEEDAHKWCTLLPVIVRTVEKIIKSLEPISRTQLIDNPWNGKLVHKCLMMILEQKIMCMHSVERLSRKDAYGPVCYTRIDVDLLKLVFLLTSQNPSWKEDIFPNEETASKTSLDPKILSQKYRSRRLFPPVKVADLTRVAGLYLERSKALGHNSVQEVTNSALLVNVIGLIPGANATYQTWKTKVQRVKEPSEASGVDNEPYYRIHRPVAGACYSLVPV
ncbi:hypothetical protein BGX38DRAFT_1153672 [Terfezia claveryi]|nr:hypothetical protein BGX38DRAFT_1153672 [Terfezia claveryi]